MPFLMVNLDDPSDCRRAMRHLNELVGGPRPGGPGGDKPERRPGPGEHRPGPCKPWKRGLHGEEMRAGEGDKLAKIRALPLPAKLERMKQRGLWKHLVAIAKHGEVAKSLAEFDQELSLPANKMRSLKAIMAKLENRFELHFLNVNLEAGQDAAGNPRYSMPPRIRKHILKLADE